MAVPVGHDHGPVRRRIGELARGLDRDGLVGAVQGPRGQVDVLVLNRIPHLVDAEAPAGQGLGVQLDAHRIFLGTEHLDLGHPVHHGDPLRHQGFAVFIHGGQRQGVRTHGQVENRLVRRVHFLIDGGRGHLRGKLGSGFGDGGLDVLAGGINAPAQGELQGNLAEPQGVGRTQVVQTGDGGELAFQRGGHCRGHGLGGGPGEIGGHQDSGKIHVGQIAHREVAIAHSPEDQDGQHDQGGHNRPADEELGEVHRAAPGC